ncbi:hypothetical protein FRC06_010267, partial [Ceratobasidium sp. 370]
LTICEHATDVAETQWINELNIVKGRELALLECHPTDLRPAVGQADDSIDTRLTISQDQTTVLVAAHVDPQWFTQIVRTVTDMEFPPNIILGGQCILNANVPVKTGVRSDTYISSFVTGERVVKKVFGIGRLEKEDMKEYTDGLLSVAKSWVTLRSDYVLPFYGIGMEAFKGTQYFQLYLVSPLMENFDAVTYLRLRRKRSNAQGAIMCIITDAARGLQYLHNRDSPIVYSKMRGDNILITDSERGVLGGVRPIDCKILQSSAGSKQPSPTGKTSETESQRWMAPEMLAEEAKIRAPSDVWGWAMTALELISGLPPYYQNKQPNTIVLDIQKIKRPVRTEHAEFENYALKPDEMWALLERCWEFAPEKRPTIDEVLVDLKRITGE